MRPATSRGGLKGVLTVTGPGEVEKEPAPMTQDVSGVTDQFSAVINIHGGNLSQIEAAIASNSHQLDPHPNDPTQSVRRHPVYLVAVDYSNVDDQGRPAAGAPSELDLETIRGIFTARPEYAEFISDGDPPSDGSHIRVSGMAQGIAELDQAGHPTGRVIVEE